MKNTVPELTFNYICIYFSNILCVPLFLISLTMYSYKLISGLSARVKKKTSSYKHMPGTNEWTCFDGIGIHSGISGGVFLAVKEGILKSVAAYLKKYYR